MSTPKPSPKQGFLARARNRLFRNKNAVPAELQQAINECATMPQLLELLFSIDYVKDEAMIATFDKRIDELEGSCLTNHVNLKH